MTQKSNGKNLNNSTNLHRAYENEKDKNKQKIYHYPINLSSIGGHNLCYQLAQQHKFT